MRKQKKKKLLVDRQELSGALKGETVIIVAPRLEDVIPELAVLPPSGACIVCNRDVVFLTDVSQAKQTAPLCTRCYENPKVADILSKVTEVTCRVAYSAPGQA